MASSTDKKPFRRSHASRATVSPCGYRDAMSTKIAVTEFSDDSVDRYADALANVAVALRGDDRNAARRALEPIAGEVWEGRLRYAGIAGTGGGAVGPRSVSPGVKARVFMRDRFVCQACGGRAIPRSLLVAVSDVFPDELPYYVHYKRGTVHPAFWAVAPEADHVRAHSAGGGGGEDNLATLHVRCNTVKADSRVEDLPQVEARPAPEDWDGLVSAYSAIVMAGQEAAERHHSLRYHREHMRRFGVDLPTDI